MKIGLLHGRFQPFHKGHYFLVNEMMKECDQAVILIGSLGIRDERNPFSYKERFNLINNLFAFKSNVHIGGNLDIPDKENHLHWNILLQSCCISLCGSKATDIYAGPEYNLTWDESISIHKYDRFMNISGTEIRKLMKENSDKVKDFIL